MKKRILSTLLAAAMAAGMLPAAGAALDSKNANAYLKAMDNMPNASSYLVDFDGDGSDELLLTWHGFEQSSYEVWDGAKKLVSKDARLSFVGADATPNQCGDLFLTEKDGVPYLYEYLILLGDEVLNIYTVQNGAWTLQEDLISIWQANPGADGPDDGRWVCTRNGKSVSRETFTALASDFQKSSNRICGAYIDLPAHSVRSEVLAALDTGVDGFPDVLSTLSAGERKALFDDFLYCVAGVDSSYIFANHPSEGFDSHTASDGEIVSLLENLRMDTKFPISGEPFPQADFTKLTQRYFGRTIDYSKFAADHQPTEMDYGYENLYYDGVFYLRWPQRGSDITLENLSGTPKQLYALGGSWYCANFIISAEYLYSYSAVIKRNTDNTWQLVRLYPANSLPTETELAAFAAPSDWAKAEVEAADSAGLIPELDGNPGWQDNTTRLQFAQLAVRLAETVTGQTLPAAPASTFTDCADLDVRKAYAAGIVNGTSDTAFSPDSKLTREQLATMLWRAANYIQHQTGEQALTAGGSLTGYTDANQVSAYAKEAVTSLAQHGIMKGTSATELSPQQNCSVEQSVLLSYRMMQQLT